MSPDDVMNPEAFKPGLKFLDNRIRKEIRSERLTVSRIARLLWLVGEQRLE